MKCRSRRIDEEYFHCYFMIRSVPLEELMRSIFTVIS
jgi:hypothetical protein